MFERTLVGIAALMCTVQVHAADATDVKLVSGNGVVFAVNVDREELMDLGTATADADKVQKGLFPEDAETPEQREQRQRCERLIAEGFKCMLPQRTYTRFNLPGVSFAVGSAALPEMMKRQLQSFAEALRGRGGSGPVVRIEGHADATGSAQVNSALSQQRAVAVRDYLISLGVSSQALATQGFGADKLRNTSDPASAENRRVEIARVLPKN